MLSLLVVLVLLMLALFAVRAAAPRVSVWYVVTGLHGRLAFAPLLRNRTIQAGASRTCRMGRSAESPGSERRCRMSGRGRSSGS
jgi:hypothetical protein